MDHNYILSTQNIIKQLVKYDIYDRFFSKEEISRWILRLTKLQIDEKINVVDGNFDEMNIYGIECSSVKNIEKIFDISNENMLQKIKKKIRKKIL